MQREEPNAKLLIQVFGLIKCADANVPDKVRLKPDESVEPNDTRPTVIELKLGGGGEQNDPVHLCAKPYLDEERKDTKRFAYQSIDEYEPPADEFWKNK